MRALAAKRSSGVVSDVASAGTAGYHSGEPPDGRSVAAAASRGYDIAAQRAQTLQTAHFEDYDLLLAMDADNLSNMRRMAPPGTVEKCRLFLSYVGHPGPETEVPDPYYGSIEDFVRVVDLSERGSALLLVKLEKMQSVRL